MCYISVVKFLFCELFKMCSLLIIIRAASSNVGYSSHHFMRSLSSRHNSFYLPECPTSSCKLSLKAMEGKTPCQSNIRDTRTLCKSLVILEKRCFYRDPEGPFQSKHDEGKILREIRSRKSARLCNELQCGRASPSVEILVQNQNADKAAFSTQRRSSETKISMQTDNYIMNKMIYQSFGDIQGNSRLLAIYLLLSTGKEQEARLKVEICITAIFTSSSVRW